jgi:hypothetical protein
VEGASDNSNTHNTALLCSRSFCYHAGCWYATLELLAPVRTLAETATLTRLLCSLLKSPLQVAGDATLELTLSQFWSSLGGSSMEVELSFHGLDAQPAAGAPVIAASLLVYGCCR